MNFGERRDVSLADLRRCRDYLTAVLGDGDELGGITEMHIHPSQGPSPRYKVGDKVRWHPHSQTQPYPEVRTVREVRRDITYILDNSILPIDEAMLSPVGCSPDGSRCAWFVENLRLHPERYAEPVVWRYCPSCKGTLRGHKAEAAMPCQHLRVVTLIGADDSRCEDCGATVPRQPAPAPRWVECPGAHVETTDGRWLQERNCDHSDGKGHPVWRFCPGTHQRRHGTCCSTPWGFLDCPGEGWERQMEA